MHDYATTTTRFATRTGLPLESSFDGGRLTSDGGLAWIAQIDSELGLCKALAQYVPEWRRGQVQHSRLALVQQRVYQIACGYEDQNDADDLRTDPLFKVVCGRLPETGDDLASQPTLSRLENAPTARACYRMAVALGELYIAQRGAEGVPQTILLDIDSTDDPTHGAQAGSSYHGYYEQHMYHPLLVFDGETGQLITAVLRPGNTHANRGIVPLLKRIVSRLRQAWPEVGIELRADAGFATPAVYEYCEAEGITYTIGLITNARLEALAEPLLAQAHQQYVAEQQKVRLLAEGRYQADSWDKERRVVYKAEVMAEGTNTRFVVTTREMEATELYNWYVLRSESENWITDFKRAIKADRLSCHRFLANQFRLLLHAAAYWLLDTLRKKLMKVGVERMQLDTLRLRLIKIGGRVREWLTCIRLHLASSHPGQHLWQVLTTTQIRS
jgi:DDE family transposase